MLKYLRSCTAMWVQVSIERVLKWVQPIFKYALLKAFDSGQGMNNSNSNSAFFKHYTPCTFTISPLSFCGRSFCLWDCICRGHPRGRFGRKSLPKLTDFSLSRAEGEVKMYRIYRDIQNLDQNFFLKLLQNSSLSESSRMTPDIYLLLQMGVSFKNQKQNSKQYRFRWDSSS